MCSWAELKMLSDNHIAEFLRQLYLKKQVSQADVFVLIEFREG